MLRQERQERRDQQQEHLRQHQRDPGHRAEAETHG